MGAYSMAATAEAVDRVWASSNYGIECCSSGTNKCWYPHCRLRLLPRRSSFSVSSCLFASNSRHSVEFAFGGHVIRRRRRRRIFLLSPSDLPRWRDSNWLSTLPPESSTAVCAPHLPLVSYPKQYDRI